MRPVALTCNRKFEVGCVVGTMPTTAAEALRYFAPAGLKGVRLGEEFGCAA
jgi:hypothetical protein